MVDASRFPTLAAYLARLPRGLESHPQCMAKGSQVRSAIEGHDLGADAEELPADIRQLFESPPSPGAWIPMVHSDAVFHVVCDRFYPTEEAMIDWCFRRTKSILSNPMYQPLVAVAGPKMFLRIADKVFFLFEKGSAMRISFGPTEAKMRIEHPPHLHSRLNHLSYVGVMTAIAECTGAREPTCELVESTPTGVILECRWAG